MTTDTPRTDACPHCGAGIYALLGLGNEITYWQCGSNPVAKGEVSRSPECYEKELSASKAEVERLRGQLQQAVEIAEVFESELDEYHSVDRNCPDAAWHYPDGWERSEEAKDKLEALNKEMTNDSTNTKK